jgi:hypothetical protein
MPDDPHTITLSQRLTDEERQTLCEAIRLLIGRRPDPPKKELLDLLRKISGTDTVIHTTRAGRPIRP